MPLRSGFVQQFAAQKKYREYRKREKGQYRVQGTVQGTRGQANRATQLATDGIQAMGGVGYMKDFGQEKRFRDAGQIQTMLGHVHLKKLRFIRQFFKS